MVTDAAVNNAEQRAALRSKIDTEARRMLHEGYAPRQVCARLGMTPEYLAELVHRRPTCPQEKCGHSQSGPGRPRAGWVQVKPAAEPAVWFCSWPCVASAALSQDGA